LRVLSENFLLINDRLTKTTKIDLVMETTPNPKNDSQKLTISNPKQNILTPTKNWCRVTALLSATKDGMSISICPLGKEEKIDLLINKVGSGWYPPVVVKISDDVRIFSLCQNGKIWYKENKLEELGHNPIIQSITENILDTLKNAGI
jgi:hypothetical protein